MEEIWRGLFLHVVITSAIVDHRPEPRMATLFFRVRVSPPALVKGEKLMDGRCLRDLSHRAG